MKIAIASNNKGKIKEFKAILEPLGYTLMTAGELGVDMDVVEETGETFAENAKLKSDYLYQETKLLSVADDSGLVIEALPDILGVTSARWMGEDTDYAIKNEKVLELLKDKKDRSAYFISVISISDGKEEHHFEGIVKGKIAHEGTGEGGFGYDPIFIPEGFNESFGVMDDVQKNEISHRARSLKKMTEYFNEK